MPFEQGQPVAPNQTHTNRAHILKLHSFKIRSNIILSPVLSLTFRFSVLNLITHLSSYSVTSTYPKHFNLPDLIAIVKCANYKTPYLLISMFHRAFFNSIIDKTPTRALFIQQYISLLC